SGPAPTPQASIKPALVQAFNLIRANRPGPARVQLHKYLEEHPGDAQALFLFGLSYHHEQKYGQAKPYLEQSIGADPNFPLTHYFLAWTRLYLGELDGSKAAFEKYRTFSPQEADVYFGLGLINLEEDRLEDAERNFK